ncbi:hypothetical protein [Mesorhizobium sp. B2-8-9]|uniref:hypothetical protein n=1 Tax=Mesorhizobium sp. B2-8-9 TaxID=2589899 RepID=UPI00112D8510|nr:hypothetical protein [Mesorhizobium sp. B2-8-9]TPI86349.1 hypothetical protein FJ423_00560 [Mesorhizobium sp. B2-8-9]
MADVIKQHFIDTQGCPNGSAEQTAKNELGQVAETLCKSLEGDPVVRIEAHGSAWNVGDKARSQSASFKFETIGDFVE